MDNDKIQAYKDKQKADSEKLEHKQELEQTINATKDSANAIIKSIAGEAQRTRQHTQNVKVANPSKDYTSDIADAVKAIKSVKLENNIDFQPLIIALNDVKKEVSKVAKDIKIPENEKVEEVSVNNLKDYTSKIDAVIKAVQSIELSPQINVQSPEVNVSTPDISKEIAKITKAIKDIKLPELPEQDDTELQNAVKDVTNAINGLEFPVPNYVLPFKDENDAAVQVRLTSGGAVPVEATLTPTPIFDIRNTEEDATYKYFGFEERGGTNWRIMRKTLATSAYLYATGTSDYATNWTGKAGLTYA
jgi:virulence-associated protein VapD